MSKLEVFIWGGITGLVLGFMLTDWIYVRLEVVELRKKNKKK